MIPEYTISDFKTRTEPYEFIVTHSNNDFAREQLRLKMLDRAKELGVDKDFDRLWKLYIKAVGEKPGEAYSEPINGDMYTMFPEQPIALRCGEYVCTDAGVWTGAGKSAKEVIFHPLTITQRIINRDTGAEKLQLAFYRRGQWQYIITDKRTVASASQIIELSGSGIAVNSENAKEVVKYLGELEALGEDKIPVLRSISRLGWIDSKTFSPYMDDLVFDGNDKVRKLYAAVSQVGSYDTWKVAINRMRYSEKGLPARIALAASFASVLVKPLGLLSFFVHLWGIQSATGKTVATMAAASVWGNPPVSEYIQTFNGTNVGLEFMAGFLNNLPLILDEFQLSKDKRAFEPTVYMLAEGSGRLRGNKQGGIRDTLSWANTIISSGESPITNAVKGAGAYNRIVEIECKKAIFDDPAEMLRVLRANYGWAGREFVEYLQDKDAIPVARAVYADYYKKLTVGDTTEKQAMAAALLLTADWLSAKWIFADEHYLTVRDVAQFLHTSAEVDTGQRAYDYLCDMVIANANRFNPFSDIGECWGKMSEERDRAYIIRSVFERICEDGGFSSRSVLSWLITQHKIEPSIKSDGKVEPTRTAKIGRSVSRCVVLLMPGAAEESPEVEENQYI